MIAYMKGKNKMKKTLWKIIETEERKRILTEKLEIAKKLKKEGMNTELIAEITGLKIKEIAEI